MSIVTVERKILKKNDEIAAENRKLFQERDIFTINLLSSPGSGKTSLLEQTLSRLKNNIRIAVVEGDVQTDRDAQRIATYNIPVVQIITNGGCHLEAQLVQNALGNFNLNDINMLIIENVGNLVCPASYDLGESKKVVIVSTTEGDDKPLKYPAMFRVSNVMIINKMDLLNYVDFNVTTAKENAHRINPNLEIIETSCSTGQGIEQWMNWLYTQIKIN
jgi:hydrogenase nickel incorporation protein HypB